MKNFRKSLFSFYLFVLMVFKATASPIDNDVCNMFVNIYDSCKRDLKELKPSDRALICNELSLKTAFYFNNFLNDKSKKGENLSKLIGKVCFEACIGEKKIYSKIRKNFCK